MRFYQEFQVILSYTVNLESAWDTQDLILNNNNNSNNKSVSMSVLHCLLTYTVFTQKKGRRLILMPHLHTCATDNLEQ